MAWFIVVTFTIVWVAYAHIPSCKLFWQRGAFLNISGAHYMLRPAPQPATAPYDFRTCFLMKARYNCEEKNITKANSLAFWEFRYPEDGNDRLTCSVEQLLLESGGMRGVAKGIRSWSHRRANVSHSNVLILGNSYLRQVYEAMTCKYRDKLETGLVVLDGPTLDLASLKVKAQYSGDELGDVIPMTREGCHSPDAEHFLPSWYTISPQLPNCTDNISMTQYAGGLRIFYVFRHFSYNEDLPGLFAKLGLGFEEVDVVVTNNKLADNAELLRRISNATPVIDFGGVLPFFKARQKRDCGWWDGAMNIGMDRPPDIHPCMPGIPDDEVDILLFSLAHRLVNIITH